MRGAPSSAALNMNDKPKEERHRSFKMMNDGPNAEAINLYACKSGPTNRRLPCHKEIFLFNSIGSFYWGLIEVEIYRLGAIISTFPIRRFKCRQIKGPKKLVNRQTNSDAESVFRVMLELKVIL